MAIPAAVPLTLATKYLLLSTTGSTACKKPPQQHTGTPAQAWGAIVPHTQHTATSSSTAMCFNHVCMCLMLLSFQVERSWMATPMVHPQMDSLVVCMPPVPYGTSALVPYTYTTHSSGSFSPLSRVSHQQAGDIPQKARLHFRDFTAEGRRCMKPLAEHEI